MHLQDLWKISSRVRDFLDCLPRLSTPGGQRHIRISVAYHLKKEYVVSTDDHRYTSKQQIGFCATNQY